MLWLWWHQIYITLGLPPPDPELPSWRWWLRRCLGHRATSNCVVGLKWVNDVLVKQKKVCGILCEATPQGVAVGIGINVNTPADFFVKAELPHASSLMVEGGRPVEMAALADRLIREVDALSERLSDPEHTARELNFYRSRLLTLGREVRIVAADGSTRQGYARDIDDRANLLVDFGTYTEAINFGDVSVRGLYGYV